MIDEKIREGNKLISNCSGCKKCSDYDEECVFVEDKYSCWFGGTRVTEDAIITTPMADGYCPFIHQSN